tara:strand:- start:632 stop:1375 length:744 start_codon:yes stop_codon:yes gene_type:complete
MEYTGSAHTGETESGRFEGEGVFKFPNGSEYVGSFKDGMFHGEGKIIVPGCGEYKATWQNGREVSSSYTFSDGLAYERENWKYCTADDRRFYSEIKHGIKPVGESQLTNHRAGDPLLEEGQYDVGDGYADVSDGKVRSFKTGEVIRFLEPGENTSWLRNMCRRGPSGTVGRDAEAALKAAFESVAADVGEEELSRADLWLSIKSNNVLGDILNMAENFKSIKEVSSEFENDEGEPLSLDAFCSIFRR